MKALVGAFNQEKALVGAFSVIIQPVVEPMDRFTALLRSHSPTWTTPRPSPWSCWADTTSSSSSSRPSSSSAAGGSQQGLEMSWREFTGWRSEWRSASGGAGGSLIRWDNLRWRPVIPLARIITMERKIMTISNTLMWTKVSSWISNIVIHSLDSSF